MKREIELDFLRGIAILMVIDYHSPRKLLFTPFRLLGYRPFGWAGVDIFFVLSGFLVGGLLIKEWKVRGTIRTRHFLMRRGFKIWPQYYCYLLLAVLTGHHTMHRLWGNFLNIQNYVGGVPHTWTLAVEEHAYLLLAVVIALAARRQIEIRHLFYGLLAAAVCVVSLRLILAGHGFDTYPRTDTRIDGILYGVMLAILYHHAPDKFHFLQRQRVLWLSILAIALVYFRFTPNVFWGDPVSWLCADAMGVALLMLLYRHREGGRRSPVYRLIAWIGLYSYGIYLWHVSALIPSVEFGHRLPHRLEFLWDELAPSILGIAVGIFFTKLVEFPTLKLRDRIIPRAIDSPVGAAAGVSRDPSSVQVAS
jgi:peptidoglycan/LPS O-acetylase OafA/YrhL